LGAHKLVQERAGTIRRVVRVEGQFVCGVCRSAYDDLPSARGCLEGCWDSFLHLNPVITKKVSGRVQHRCRFCARDYDNNAAARQCAEQCRQNLMRKIAAEARVADKEDSMPVRKPLRNNGPKRAVTRVVMPAAPVRRKPAPAVVPDAGPAVDDLVEDAVSTITADANEKTVEPAAMEPAANAPAAGKKKKPSEVFYRDQAKYVCTVCNEKYFTKVEVTKCYDSHE
jgi:hypothetical protein